MSSLTAGPAQGRTWRDRHDYPAFLAVDECLRLLWCRVMRSERVKFLETLVRRPPLCRDPTPTKTPLQQMRQEMRVSACYCPPACSITPSSELIGTPTTVTHLLSSVRTLTLVRTEICSAIKTRLFEGSATVSAGLATMAIPPSSRGKKGFDSDRACRDSHDAYDNVVLVGKYFDSFLLELRTETLQSHMRTVNQSSPRP